MTAILTEISYRLVTYGTLKTKDEGHHCKKHIDLETVYSIPVMMSNL